MHLTQYLIFEIVDRCDLAGLHRRCPILRHHRDDRREAPMTDAEIIEAAQVADAAGFRGLIGWHYYCEPTLAWPRIMGLLPRLRAAAPHSQGFTLWTNGSRLDSIDVCELAEMRQIVITNYAGRLWSALGDALPHVDLRIHRPAFDSRAAEQRGGGSRCLRPYNELVLDYYGTAHLCCYDYAAAVPLGSLRDAGGMTAIVDRFREVREALARSENLPSFCARCGGKMTRVGRLVDGIWQEAQQHVAQMD